MGYLDDIQKILKQVLERHNGNKAAAAASLGVNSVTFWGWIEGTRIPTTQALAPLMDKLNASVLLPDEDQSREVCFVDAKTVEAGEDLEPPASEDYFAVPLVDEVGAGNGYIPQEKLRSWLLVWRWQSAVRHRSNLVAVEIAKDADSMVPTLFPGDIVLIDRDERRVENNGKMWLVRDPSDESTKIKRVALKTSPEEKDVRITYYSDNSDYPPEAYSLKEDFYNDLARAIVGRVVWAWSDVTNK